MASVNKVILIGNLGKDPEIRYFDGGVAKATFSLATTEYFKDKNGNKAEQTEWHYCVLWRALAENAERILKKGSQIYLEGKLQSRSWNDKDGNKKSITEIVGDSFILLGKRDQTQSGAQDNESTQNDEES